MKMRCLFYLLAHTFHQSVQITVNSGYSELSYNKVLVITCTYKYNYVPKYIHQLLLNLLFSANSSKLMPTHFQYSIMLFYIYILEFMVYLNGLID